MSTTDTAVSYFTGMEQLDTEAAIQGYAEDGSYLGIEHRDGKIHRKLYEGKAAIRAYIGAWLGSVSALKYTLHFVVGNDKTVMIEWSDVATKKTGGEYRNQGVLVYDMNAAGKIQQARAYYDFAPLEELDFSSGMHTATSR
jgi:ketosteroid isomerase-like protein